MSSRDRFWCGNIEQRFIDEQRKNKERKAPLLRFSEGSYSTPIRSTNIRKKMIRRNANIHNWKSTFLFSFDRHDEELIIDALSDAGAPFSIASKVSENIYSGRRNEGFTYSNPSIRRSVVGIGKTTSGPEVLDTTVHEIVHIAQHIAMKDGIDPFSEDFAYLCGHISREVSDVVCKLSCPHCSGA